MVPLRAHVEKLVELLGSQGFALTSQKKVQYLRINNAQLLGLVASDGRGHELMYFVTFDYPVVSPIVFYQRRGVTANLKLHWDGLKEPDDSLARLAGELLDEWSSVPAAVAAPLDVVSTSTQGDIHDKRRSECTAEGGDGQPEPK